MLGYRGFFLDEHGLLRSPYAVHVWTRTGNWPVCQQPQSQKHLLLRAKDRKYPDGVPCKDPPEPDCFCGFYAYPTLAMAVKKVENDHKPNCLGVVRAYHRVIVHEDGVIRAQTMEIVALAMPRRISPWKFTQITETDVRRVRETLEVPAALFDNVPQAALWLEEQDRVYRNKYQEFEPIDPKEWTG